MTEFIVVDLKKKMEKDGENYGLKFKKKKKLFHNRGKQRRAAREWA